MTAVKQGLLIVLAVATLAACQSTVPDSGQGVGFGDYGAYELERARREAQLTGAGATAAAGSGRFAPPAPVAAAPLNSTTAIPTSDLASAGIGQSNLPPLTAINTSADPTRTQGIDASPANAAPNLANNPGISDEQDFDAVASRETIQSDAQRRAQQAAAMVVVEPTAVPDRPRDTGPNIVEYALSAPNRKGQEWYSRSFLSGQSRFQRNCSEYASPDAAQRDFLSRGGPDRDPRGIDPDGDGFACGWDPAPFLLAAGN